MLATEALKILKRKGLRMTPQRQAIVAEVMRSRGHISATAIAARVQSRMPGVTPSTIYRTLDVLEDVGLLSHSHLERGAEYHHAAESGHVHLTCSRCGSEDDLSMDEAESLETLERALELGINFLDTADVYGPLKNEELLGQGQLAKR